MSCESWDGRRSALHPTRRIGIVGPHILRTSSIHCIRHRNVNEKNNEGGDYAYLYGDVFQRIRSINGEGNQDDMRLGV